MEIHRVFKGGNGGVSVLVVLPSGQAKELGIRAGDHVSLEVDGQRIIVERINKEAHP